MINYMIIPEFLFQKSEEIKKQYWPDSGEKQYHNIRVKTTSTTTYAFYVERCLTVTRDNCIRNITHLQYTNWPDHDVPKSAEEILYLYYKVKALKRKGPLLVHCSAGVGRTGTFIALDILLEQSKAEDQVDVFKCVSGMRKDRCEMVQTQKQYR